MDNCPTCGTSFKVSLLKTVVNRLSDNDQDLISDYFGIQPQLCTKCGATKLKDATQQMNSEIAKLNKELPKLMDEIPILTTEAPSEWLCEHLNMVGGTIAMGTGLLSEISSGLNDTFGTSSNTLRKKLLGGEKQCRQQMLLEAVELGGNAVVGARVDYDEIGSVKSMLLVKMFGTAVRIQDLSRFSDAKREALLSLDKKSKRLILLTEYKNKL